MQSMGSRAPGLHSCGSGAQEAHRLRCPTARGVSPTRGVWHAGLDAPQHAGSPRPGVEPTSPTLAGVLDHGATGVTLGAAFLLWISVSSLWDLWALKKKAFFSAHLGL